MSIETLLEEIHKTQRLRIRLYVFLSLLALGAATLFSYRLSLYVPVHALFLMAIFCVTSVLILKKNKPKIDALHLIDDRFALRDRLKSYESLSEDDRDKRTFILNQANDSLPKDAVERVKERSFFPSAGFRFPIGLTITFIFWALILELIPSRPPISEELQKLVESLEKLNEETTISEDAKQALDKLQQTIENFGLGSIQVDNEIQNVEQKLQEEVKKEEKQKQEAKDGGAPQSSPTPSDNSPQEEQKQESSQKEDSTKGADKAQQQSSSSDQQGDKKSEEQGAEGKKSDKGQDKDGQGDGAGQGQGSGQGNNDSDSKNGKSGQGQGTGQGNNDTKGEGEGQGAQGGSQGNESGEGAEKSEVQKAQDTLEQIKKAQQEAKEGGGKEGQGQSDQGKQSSDSPADNPTNQSPSEPNQSSKSNKGNDPTKQGAGDKPTLGDSKSPQKTNLPNTLPPNGNKQNPDLDPKQDGSKKPGPGIGQETDTTKDETSADKRLSDISMDGALGEGIGFKDEKIEVGDEHIDKRYAVGEVQLGEETKGQATSKYQGYSRLEGVPEIKEYDANVKIPPEYQGIIKYDNH